MWLGQCGWGVNLIEDGSVTGWGVDLIEDGEGKGCGLDNVGGVLT